MPQQESVLDQKTWDRRVDVLSSHGETHYLHLAALGAPTLKIAVRFADEASSAFSAYREKYAFAASEMKTECGNIYNSQNLLVGRISYNGRIWNSNGNVVE